MPLSPPSIPLIPASVAVAGNTLQPTTMAPLSESAATKPTEATEPKPKQAPYRVANSIVPIPGKLVKRIQALDMRELLPDNIALAERLAVLAPPKPPGEREIGGDQALLTWVSSFATYVAVVAEVQPKRVGDMLAYMRLIVREASKFGGNGWLTYDSVFRRNQEGLSTPWNVLDASLHQVYIANQLQHPASTAMRWTTCVITAVYPRSLTPPAALLTLCLPQAPQSEGRQRENARSHTPGSGLYAHHGMGEAASSRASVCMLMCVSTAMAAIQPQPAEKGPTPVQSLKGSRPPLQQRDNDGLNPSTWDIKPYSSLVL